MSTNAFRVKFPKTGRLVDCRTGDGNSMYLGPIDLLHVGHAEQFMKGLSKEVRRIVESSTF